MQAQARTRLKGDRAPGRTVSTVPSDGFWETGQALVYGLRPVRCVQDRPERQRPTGTQRPPHSASLLPIRPAPFERVDEAYSALCA